jgi:hypothetical protein
MNRYSLVLATLLSTIFSHIAYGDTICVEWKDKQTILTNSKATWDGEALTIRYYNDTGSTIESAIDLTYDQTNTIRASTNAGIMAIVRGGVAPNTWASSSFQLPYRPSSYYIHFTESKCIKTREKTWLEKLKG